MRTSNFTEGRRVAGFFRLCLGIIISLTLAAGGMALNTQPVKAADPVIIPLVQPPINPPECVTFTTAPLNITSSCTNPPMTPCPGWPNEIHWFWWASANPPAWLHLDPATGQLTGCPDAGSSAAPPYNALIGCTSMLANGTPPGGPCPAGSPCPAEMTTALTHASILITVAPPLVGATPPTCLAIDPMVYPAAWEGMLYSITLTATLAPGVGPLNWTATNLPPGLVLDPLTGILSGIPGPGTCGPWTVTVTCTDTGVCPGVGCCAPVSAPLYLYVDCWANYLVLIGVGFGSSTGTTSCDFNVTIGPGLTEGQTPVYVDGTQVTSLGGNQSETVASDPCETHLVVVDQIVQGPDPNTSFECIGSNSKMVDEFDNTAYFDYAKKVLINTRSDPGGVAPIPGTGFYAVGGYFRTSAASPVNPYNQQDTKYTFREWSGPDGSRNPNRDLVFTVDRAGDVTAYYDAYFKLTLTSDYPPVDQSQWEIKGGTANYNLALQPSPMLGFWGFLGGVVSPLNSSGSRIMDGPYIQKINWVDDYTVPIIIIVITLLIIAAAIYFWRRRGVAGSAGKTGAATQASADETTAVKTATVDTAEPKSLPKAAPAESITVMPALSAPPAAKKALPEAEPKEKPKFCISCGEKAVVGATYCKNCGKEL